MATASLPELGRRAQAAARVLATATTEAKDAALLAAADLPGVSEALAKAFDDDPFVAYLLPEEARNRHRRLASFMGQGAEGASLGGRGGYG